MLNEKQERELAYVVIIDGIQPIPGYDRVEHAIVGGWYIIVQKGQFKVGDPAIYFEIDSRVPSDRECFAFLKKRHYKVKTLKMCKTISQGLLMHASDFGWTIDYVSEMRATEPHGMAIIDNDGEPHFATDESRFLTKKLGVTYADDEDNQRKAAPVDKYKKMAQRHPSIFKKSWARWLMKRTWGRKLMFAFFGKKKDKKNGWPAWVKKTDEERVQNMPWIIDSDDTWIATEKIDGTSTTFTMKRGKFGKKEFYVCSRNVCFDKVDKPCYYDTNVYWEMAQKYNMYEVLDKLLTYCFFDDEWVTIQGETYGAGVQKRDYSIEGHDFMAFNLITSTHGRYGTEEMKCRLEPMGIPCVPVLKTDINFLHQYSTLEDLILDSDGDSIIDGKPREGIVYRTKDGSKSFKAVSNEYLLKYHS